ncbi:MAG TPA: hypothetical protein HA232_02710 [Methanocellales archaeon]|nr:hypothetical protein [Methanocellales archaeon]
MKMGRRKFLKSIAFAGAMAAMGFSGCISSPEPTPTPTPAPTPKPLASEPTQTTKTFFDVGTELKQCPWCGVMMYLRDHYGELFWVCPNDDCGYIEKVTEPDILKKYGYTDQLKSI